MHGGERRIGEAAASGVAGADGDGPGGSDGPTVVGRPVQDGPARQTDGCLKKCEKRTIGSGV